MAEKEMERIRDDTLIVYKHSNHMFDPYLCTRRCKLVLAAHEEVFSEDQSRSEHPLHFSNHLIKA